MKIQFTCAKCGLQIHHEDNIPGNVIKCECGQLNIEKTKDTFCITQIPKQEEPEEEVTKDKIINLSSEEKLALILRIAKNYDLDEHEGDWGERAQAIMFVASGGKTGDSWGIAESYYEEMIQDNQKEK